MSILIHNRKKMCQYFYLLAPFGYHVNTDAQQKENVPILLSTGSIWLSCQYWYTTERKCANTSIYWLHLVIMSILIHNRKKMCQYFYLLAPFGYHVNTDAQQKENVPILLSTGSIWLSCQYWYTTERKCVNTSIYWLHLVIMSILMHNRKKMGQYFYLLASFGYCVSTNMQQQHFFLWLWPPQNTAL